MKLLFVLIVLLGSFHVLADRWKELFVLTQKEIVLIEKAKSKPPRLEYRLIELYSERLKLVQEQENKAYLKASQKSGKALDKKAYFSKTAALYNRTQAFAQNTLKKNPRHQFKSEIMLTVALNARDYNPSDTSQLKYLIEALKTVSPRSPLRHRIIIALADYYYNEKNYMFAIKYYLDGVKTVSDSWLPKHYYNLSWCYLMSQQYDQAIDAIKKSYFLGLNKQYVSIAEQVIENISTFFVYAKRALEGMDFLVRYSPNPVEDLIKLNQKASNQGQMKEAERVLAKAREIANKRNNYYLREQVISAHLDFYRQFSRHGQYLNESKLTLALYKARDKDVRAKKYRIKNGEDLKEENITKIREVAGYYQLRVAKDVKKGSQGNYNKDDLSMVKGLFGILKQLDPTNRGEYSYFLGETYFSIKSYLPAAKEYVASISFSIKKKDLKMAKKGLDSLLALTGQEELPPKENRKYLSFAYSNHVTLFPKDELSKSIYPKLANLYREDKQWAKTETTIDMFHQNFPGEVKDQQNLSKLYFNDLLKASDIPRLNNLIKKIKLGYLKFPPKDIESMENALGSLLFNDFKQMALKGKNNEALKGFGSIYKNEIYTNKIRGQSAYFASLVALDLGLTRQSLDWVFKADQLMLRKEKDERREEIARAIERHYKLQDMDTSLKLSEFTLKRDCNYKDKINDRIFSVGVNLSLATGSGKTGYDFLQNYHRCLSNQSFMEKSREFMFTSMVDEEDWQRAYNLISTVPKMEKYFVDRLREKFFTNSGSERLKALNLMKSFSGKVKSFNDFIEKDAYLGKLQNISQKLISDPIWNQPQFNPEAFNKALEKHLGDVNQFKNDLRPIAESGDLHWVEEGLYLASQTFFKISENYKGLNPKGTDPEVFKAVKETLNSIASGFFQLHRTHETNLMASRKKYNNQPSHLRRQMAGLEGVNPPNGLPDRALPMDGGVK